MTPALQANCLEALTESASEVAATVLGGAPFEASPANDGFGTGHGAYLGLVAQEEPIQVGILVDAAGCQAFAKALLGMEPADEDLPAADVSDAMCEIINIVAGGLKRRIAAQLTVTLGLPLFVTGHPLPNQQQEVIARALKIGGVPARLILLTQKQDAAPLSRSAVSLQNAVIPAAKEQSA